MTLPSRYYQRWTSAAPDREAQVAALAAGPADQLDLPAQLAQLTATGLPPARALRRLRNLLVCTLIRRDLEGAADLNEVVSAMTAFADFAVQTMYEVARHELVALHGAPVSAETGRVLDMLVLAMGKHGGGELNVSSDIDLIFVYPDDGETAAGSGQRQLSNHEFFIRLGKKLIAGLAEVTEDGFVFRVDMALRPNGGSGPLAASLNMVEEYLIVQGREWERYAWVKARAVTGQAEDIAALDAIVRPFVYRRYLDFGMIDAIRSMHAQIRAEVKRQERLHPDRSNNVKLGRGGIREIEFLAQVFQLIRGGRDAALRDRSTRATLRTIAEKDLLAPAVVERLLESYTFLRNLEHRLQYLEDAQTHTLPVSEDDRLTVARMLGLPDVPSLLAALDAHRAFVAEQFDAIFAEKAGGAEEVDPAAGAYDEDNRAAIEARLAELGYDDPRGGAQRLLAAWLTPRLQTMPEASRTKMTALLNAALPLIARIAAESGLRGSYTATLGRLLDFFEAIARRSAYLSLLTEYPHTLERVLRMMHASGWAATFLTQHPILLDELLDDRARSPAPSAAELQAELSARLAEVAGDTERQMDVLREIHHVQLFRLLAQDLAGDLTVERLADHLSQLADAIVAATIPAVWQTIAKRHREVPRFAVIAYGKLGGKELGYVSDLDVIFLYDDEDQDAPTNYARLAQRFITWMTTATPAGTLFDIDTALRPDGASGMLVSTVAAFERYQQASAWVWEHQALSRARFCAGDAEIGARFEQIRCAVLRQPRDAAPLREEVLAMRQKMREAHPPRGELFDLKHDEGGMIDVEFIVQYLVLLHASAYAQLTANSGNIALLRTCGELGLIDADLARGAADAYRAMRKLQHGARLQGSENARIDPALAAPHAAAVQRLWSAVFA
ncbi:bifunctional [glutamate--ammonia ligase]-adenylyl-L-tyrosine phosphorylase/[glutamate--ammonia-ligase] adenylyltransferase [Massilia arenosa]|uniref:Bifunctional glutamine synthetase adenylyltransferase/adenylyl-removing enzyme n=1 Tax=Zemynaea arenosa TaxID=2561931 RepID=A0A4Y9SHX0_9BURK|nr:bifunctional [glutamate--ammonia ligase]-adenylyl-L-tyrosine phosphorylase/[glutamate--ammonia-ligase] adenylyltransferase [Massilia arenosa]TFW24845.1 bifunctional [glutamate--ammonia ligase]-adenylyl-L-tyrosine phosphorylase/[glutamate--ammonia-ligase] adenylyltransferase [Massilia arenosa]